MTVQQGIDLFRPGAKFVHNKELFEVKNSKTVSNMLVIITDKRTLNLYPSEIADFVNEASFDIANVPQKKEYVAENVPATSDAFDIKKMWLPQGSAKAKEALENMLDLFADPEKIDADSIKKANALCMISDKIVSVERLQLDFVKLQKGK